MLLRGPRFSIVTTPLVDIWVASLYDLLRYAAGVRRRAPRVRHL